MIFCNRFSVPTDRHINSRKIVFITMLKLPPKPVSCILSISCLFSPRGWRSFTCFLIRAAWSPRYMQIDAMILCTHILQMNQRSFAKSSNLDLWSRVVDLDSRPFKQTKGKGLSFFGTLQTDGVGVNVIKQNFPSRKAGRQKKAKVLDEDVPYVYSLAIEQRCLEGRCVLVDPGRRDLLFCMHEYSEPNARILYHYTSCQKTKKYRRIRENYLANSQMSRTRRKNYHSIPFQSMISRRIVAIYGKQQAYLRYYRISMRTRRQTYHDTLFSENCASHHISIHAKQTLDWREP
ncbi:uncharacterized protein BYT42DRAFT_122957 [Radiomyces spectabilis]|uniref:uncharacterized protein n=1 Tax=Radiomyces spectabilis TaxID=64574 RepID=UPI00221F7828|nr:uncharacterized protein BYT42DRAFT_122957 [Radiomyces spectabilis]KAI8368224.1 hypothetical protein BYT42DRAFT_122957 [Radiomyces spectabilis]